MSQWIDKAVFYHIYPLGFCGAEKNAQECSEIKHRILKVIDWIPHLKELNITAVYMGPVFESVEHGYDTVDYTVVDRRLGTNEDFVRVCEELHANGISVILDGVFNHVGRDFFAFKDVIANREASRYCGWFRGLDFYRQSPMGDSFSYECWSGCYNLVKLNLSNPEVAEYLKNCIRGWIDKFKIDGIRFDVADCLDVNFIRDVHNLAKSIRPDFWLMGEVIHGNYSQWANPDMFDSVTNYQCYKGIYSSHNDRNLFEIAHNIDQQIGQYGNCKGIKLYNFLDNHDVNRLADTLKIPAHMMSCYTLMYAMCGYPSVYYGSEFGIHGVKHDCSDADLRPCLDLDEARKNNPELTAHISKLGMAVKEHPSLNMGSYERLYLNNRQLLIGRAYENDCVYAAINIDDSPYTFIVPSAESLTDILSGRTFLSDGGSVRAEVFANSSMLLCVSSAETTIEETSHPAEKAAPHAEEKLTPYPEGEIAAGQSYRHFKGNEYTVVGIASDSETLTDMVVYRNSENKLWVRSLAMFNEIIERDGKTIRRFTRLD